MKLNETHRISRYRTFSRLYSINNFQLFVNLYDIDELLALMPTNPTPQQKHIFNSLIGVTGERGYLDYQKSNNTYAIVRQFQAETSSPISRNRNRNLRMR